MAQMRIDLNKEPNSDSESESESETVQFRNFSIRAYVAEIREKDPEKCWPFSSVCAYKDFDTQTGSDPASGNVNENGNNSDGRMENTEAPDPFEAGTSRGNRDCSETLAALEVDIPERNEAGFETLIAMEVEIQQGNEAGAETSTALEVEAPKGDEAITKSPTATEAEISKGNAARFEAPHTETPKGDEAVSEAPPVLEVEVRKEDEAGSKTHAETITSKDGNNNTSSNEVPGQNGETTDLAKHSRTFKKRKFRLLSELLRDLQGPSSEPHAHFSDAGVENVNPSFTVDVQGNADEVTLEEFLKKRKGQQMVQADEAGVGAVNGSSPGPAKKRKGSLWAESHNELTKLVGSFDSCAPTVKRRGSGVLIVGSQSVQDGPVLPGPGLDTAQVSSPGSESLQPAKKPKRSARAEPDGAFIKPAKKLGVKGTGFDEPIAGPQVRVDGLEPSGLGSVRCQSQVQVGGATAAGGASGAIREGGLEPAGSVSIRCQSQVEVGGATADGGATGAVRGDRLELAGSGSIRCQSQVEVGGATAAGGASGAVRGDRLELAGSGSIRCQGQVEVGGATAAGGASGAVRGDRLELAYSGSIRCQSQVEVGGATAAVGASGAVLGCGGLVCSVNRNPAEFSIPNARKFMRRC